MGFADQGLPGDPGLDQFGRIDMDIDALEQVAKRLEADVEEFLTPRVSEVGQVMSTTSLAPTMEGFQELASFLQVHRNTQTTLLENIYNFAKGTQVYAVGAQQISQAYRGSDDLSAIKSKDVTKQFDAAPRGLVSSGPTTANPELQGGASEATAPAFELGDL